MRDVQREVIHGDALAWLRDHPAQAGCSVLASMPDVRELGVSLPAWEVTFREAARLCLLAAAPDGLCCFFQTDMRHEGRWISKAGMVLEAAAALGIPLLWHKIICRHPPGTVSRERAGFSHLLAFSRAARVPAGKASPDVLPDLGGMPWSHSMGTRAATRVMRDVRDLSPTTTTILQPFCGIGTALAVANAHGFHAIGIEQNSKRARTARTLTMQDVRDAAARTEDARLARLARRRPPPPADPLP